jgi:hypothetical protein
VIVIADTSVILNLCCVEQQQLLRSLFREVIIPPEVRQEFERAAQAYPRFSGLRVPDWIAVRPAHLIPVTISQSPHLDMGEIAAIALALELKADAVLIDETDGREAARKHGLVAIGVLGILLRAREAGLVALIGPILDQLENKANFWVRPEVRAAALRMAGELH